MNDHLVFFVKLACLLNENFMFETRQFVKKRTSCSKYFGILYSLLKYNVLFVILKFSLSDSVKMQITIVNFKHNIFGEPGVLQ